MQNVSPDIIATAISIKTRKLLVDKPNFVVISNS